MYCLTESLVWLNTRFNFQSVLSQKKVIWIIVALILKNVGSYSDNQKTLKTEVDF